MQTLHSSRTNSAINVVVFPVDGHSLAICALYDRQDESACKRVRLSSRSSRWRAARSSLERRQSAYSDRGISQPVTVADGSTTHWSSGLNPTPKTTGMALPYAHVPRTRTFQNSSTMVSASPIARYTTSGVRRCPDPSHRRSRASHAAAPYAIPAITADALAAHLVQVGAAVVVVLERPEHQPTPPGTVQVAASEQPRHSRPSHEALARAELHAEAELKGIVRPRELLVEGARVPYS